MVPLNVLVIDDDRSAFELIMGHVDQLGFQERIALHYANTVSDAIDLISKLHPDIVLLDLRMPEADGVEHLKRIKALRPDVPVLIFSMYHPDPKKMKEAGADGVLDKEAMQNTKIFGNSIVKILNTILWNRLNKFSSTL